MKLSEVLNRAEYPMRTLSEMEQSLARAASDCRANRITEADYKEVSARFALRLRQIRKQEFLTSVARIRTRSSNDPLPERKTMPRGGQPMRRQQGRGR